ncbi:MAG: T9SS type A sorting domain-containing protein [Ignavibacteriae bacterium]|nr:T9SS type A sorting domain-containing protein [Ignavibacteriota bacterium]MCB9242891.1 T9SS type A sorting domain-containing protein [Ignavibacteriales bacterium]
MSQVQNISNISDSYSLSQNYPNPFNPSTTIGFSIRNRGFVTLRVYDITGKEVKSLVNEYLERGEYNVTFIAAGLSSGIYFYSLTTEDFRETKSMILTK